MKIFKISLLISSLLVGNVLFSQEKDDAFFKNLLPKEGNLGVSIVLTGLIDNLNFSTKENEYNDKILFAKYYLKDDLVLRSGFGLNLLNSKRQESVEENGITTEMDSIAKQTTFNISAGIEKHLTQSKRLDPYLFSQIDFSFIGKQKFETETRLLSTAGNAKSKRDITKDGGFGVALNIGGGFNYFFAENFSLGSEIQMGLNYLKTGGITSITDSQTDINGKVVSVFTDSEDIISGTTISVQPTALVHLTYFF